MKWLAIGGAVVVVLGVGVGLLVRSCAADKAAAERTVAQLYDALGREDYEAAVALYHPDAYARRTKAQMVAQLQSIDRDLGRRQDGHLIGWEIQKGSQSWVDLTYENQYEHGRVFEWFHLVKLDGTYRILVHNYEAAGAD